mmetsp:Transcript_27100/g.41189  ORF Transcript_27100/g.41189 Transcript_27100/m.41189 type:complete len:100 (+) Transcript_27100:264-563(+)
MKMNLKIVIVPTSQLAGWLLKDGSVRDLILSQPSAIRTITGQRTSFVSSAVIRPAMGTPEISATANKGHASKCETLIARVSTFLTCQKICINTCKIKEL